MAKPSMSLTGDRALIAALGELPRTIGGPALDVSMRRGLALIQEAAMDNIIANRSVQRVHNKHPGWPIAKEPRGQWLLNSMKTAKESGRARHNPKFRLGFVGRGRRIAHLVEFGTAPHYQPKRGVMHPGARANPFIRPAFESRKTAAVRLILKHLKNQVELGAEALRRKFRRMG